MPPSPVIDTPMIIPVSDPQASADSWTLFMGKWDHVFITESWSQSSNGAFCH